MMASEWGNNFLSSAITAIIPYLPFLAGALRADLTPHGPALQRVGDIDWVDGGLIHNTAVCL